MRKMLLSLLAVLAAANLAAQMAKEDFKKNIRLSGSNYIAYPGPQQRQLTPAPDGMKPFYISHYGRHGSRYFINSKDYEYAYRTLEKAAAKGKLTPLGEDVLRRVVMMRQEADRRHGELTELGAQQHKDIARRMFERFPEVFEGEANIEARSTTVIRCILSMENALQQLLVLNPRLHIFHDASLYDMYYMNQQDKQLMSKKSNAETRVAFEAFCKKHACWQRAVGQLFNDTAYVSHKVNGERLNYYLFKMASCLQNSELRKKITFYDLFTDDEILENWRRENVMWYMTYSAYPLNGGQQPFTQRNLLRKIIEQADSCIRLEKPGATLRFGHETMVMPLVCLLELDNYGLQTTNLEQVEKKGWLNYRIFPMAANLQFVFYRDSPQGEVWLKVLLNENEATLPLKARKRVYYRWTDFREFCLKKLDSYHED